MQAKRSADWTASVTPSNSTVVSVQSHTLFSGKAPQIVLAVATGLLVANCGSQKVGSRGGGIDPKYGVAASPKMVEDGEDVPKGGGRAMVGKPYVVAGRLYTPREMSSNYSAVGLASWYGPSFHGRMTANGEVFDKMSITVAHPTMPLPSYVRVTNTGNGRSIIARVNDRGPYHGNRLVDVSERVAEALSFRQAGTARVRVDYIGRASTSGSDDEKLYATLRTDGAPARVRGDTTYVASADDITPVASARVTPIQQSAEQAAASSARWPSLSPAPAAVPAPVAAPVATAVAAPVAPALSVGKPAPGVPLPPDRPFDLRVTSPRPLASTPGFAPTPGIAPMPIPRTALRSSGSQTAGLFFAEPEPDVAQTFRKSDPMAALIEQNFVPLKGRSTTTF